MSARMLLFPSARAKSDRAQGDAPSGDRAPVRRVYGRGVYHAPFLLGRDLALMAVDSAGVLIAQVPLHSDVDAESVANALHELLELVDPTEKPTLELVR